MVESGLNKYHPQCDQRYFFQLQSIKPLPLMKDLAGTLTRVVFARTALKELSSSYHLPLRRRLLLHSGLTISNNYSLLSFVCSFVLRQTFTCPPRLVWNSCLGCSGLQLLHGFPLDAPP